MRAWENSPLVVFCLTKSESNYNRWFVTFLFLWRMCGKKEAAKENKMSTRSNDYFSQSEQISRMYFLLMHSRLKDLRLEKMHFTSKINDSKRVNKNRATDIAIWIFFKYFRILAKPRKNPSKSALKMHKKGWNFPSVPAFRTPKGLASPSRSSGKKKNEPIPLKLSNNAFALVSRKGNKLYFKQLLSHKPCRFGQQQQCNYFHSSTWKPLHTWWESQLRSQIRPLALIGSNPRCATIWWSHRERLWPEDDHSWPVH